MLSAFLALVATQFPIGVVKYQSPEPYSIPFRKAWLDTVAVQVKVKGKDAWFMLDTGAISTYLFKKTWKDLKLDEDEATVGVEVSCGTVTALLDVAKVPENLEKANEAYAMKLDGILGLDFLEGCGIGIDRPAQAIVLFPPRVLSADRLRIWFGSSGYVKDGKPRWMPWCAEAHLIGEKSLSPIPFEPTQLGAQVFDTPLLDQRLAATLSVKGAKIDCVFDTGACPTSLLESPIKAQVRYETDKIINYSIDGAQYIKRGTLDTLKLGEFELIPAGGMRVTTSDKPVLDGLGLVGMDVFSRNKTLLDLSSQTVSFARYAKPPAGTDGSRLYHAEIYDPSTAQVLRLRAGTTLPFRQGDIVLSGASHVKVLSAKDGITMLQID